METNIEIDLAFLKSCVLEDNKTILVTLTNSGYLLYTLNMLKSLKKFNLDKHVLIVCLDKIGTNKLKKLGYQVICTSGVELKDFCDWNSFNYDKICYLKLEIIYKLLLLNKNVLLIDGDIVFKKNPLNDIKLWWEDNINEVFVQNDLMQDCNTSNMCTGYIFIKSSVKLVELFNCMSDSGKNKYSECIFRNNDQTYFNRYVKPKCVFKALPLKKYPNGNMYYNNVEKIKDDAVLIHFNWIQGQKKLIKMKEHNMWFLTTEEENL